MYLTFITNVHVLISLAGIVSGFVVLFGLLTTRRFDRWTAFFLATTVATSVTGFLFPYVKFMPSHAVGILSMLVLPVAIFARYRKHLRCRWRTIYVVTAMSAQYLNVFVLIAQGFQKVPALKALAPTQTELPFALSQGAVFSLFATLTFLAANRFKINVEPVRAPVRAD